MAADKQARISDEMGTITATPSDARVTVQDARAHPVNLTPCRLFRGIKKSRLSFPSQACFFVCEINSSLLFANIALLFQAEPKP